MSSVVAGSVHVFLETNWVYDAFAPTHLRKSAATRLLRRAARNELTLHLPAICLREGADVIRQKCQPRVPRELKEFRRLHAQRLGEDGEAFLRVLDVYTSTVKDELDSLSTRLSALERASNVDIFALSDEMLSKAIELRSALASVTLKPFDEAILAGTLVRAATVGGHATRRIFCTTDRDLHPVDRAGSPKPALKDLYDVLGLEVRGDFSLE